MKRGLIILLLVSILFLQLVSAETTFFEGDLDYKDDFTMAPIPEETPTGIYTIDVIINEKKF